MTDKKLESLAYRLNDLKSLRKLFSELNFDFADKPVNKNNWSEEQKKIVQEAKIIASKNDYQIYYIRTDTDSLKEWKGIATKIIKDKHGFCMICSHNPSGFKWVFSSLSKEFSKSFSETRHVPIDIKPNVGVPKTFVDFLEKIRIDKESSAASIVSKVSKAFDSFAIQIHDELTANVFEALKILSEGIILDKSNNLTLDNQTLEEIREPSFILLYRIIFILYAEDRMIFPTEQHVYHEKFSFKWIKQEWLLHPKNQKKISEYDVQARLWNFFRLIELGSSGLGYDSKEFFMKSYYGRLFDKEINSKLDKWKIKNKYLLEVVSLLTGTRDKQENYFFLDYSALETRHLGSIYEHLLEYHLTIKNNEIIELANAKDKKSSGSYYTPQYIVDYIAENTIGPLIDEIINKTDDKSEQIDKILAINILDPSMGSGHFLIGATNYIANRICEIESEGEITEQAFVERKRDVARRCIYGVDLNPLAVDLASVALWLETLASEKPLSFLSAHLKQGNSLIGSSIDAILEKQTTLMESTSGRTRFKKTIRDFIMLENLDDDTAHAVKTKIEKYDNMQSKGTIYYDLKFMLNAKLAKSFGIDVPPLGDYITKIGKNNLDFLTESDWGQKVKEITQEQSFFHWDLEFLDIFYDEDGKRKKNPGFDVVLGNPPWQIIKPNIDEFFSSFYDLKNADQKFSQLPRIGKDDFIKDCLTDKEINDNYIQYNENYKKQMKFFSNDNYYYQTALVNGKKQYSDLNLYKLFVEKSYKLIDAHGYCGLVTPSGIYSDLGSKGLRELIFTNTKLINLFSFINRKEIFKGVSSGFKFCILIFEKTGMTDKFLASFYLEDVARISDYNQTAYKYDINFIKQSSPDSLSVLECSNKNEFQIMQKLYRHPLLSSNELTFHPVREFHMTDDSSLFHNTNIGLPLYEGKMISSFTQEFAKPRYWIDESKGSEILRKKELYRMKKINKNHNVNPQLDYQQYRLVWRDITNSAAKRGLISTILPPNVFLGNTLNYVRPNYFNGTKYKQALSNKNLFYLCGVLNSFPLDFILRHKIFIHASMFYVKELPIPEFDNENKFQQKIFTNTAKLICTTNEFAKLRKELEISEFATSHDKRLILESQINACVAKIYNLDKNDLKNILNTFPIVEDKLKELTLDEFVLLESKQ